MAVKSVKQRFSPSESLLSAMEESRMMTNDCIRIGLGFEKEHMGATVSMKRLSELAYGELKKRYETVYSKYRASAISKAAGILSARRKSEQRGFRTKTPYLSRRVLVSCYGFRIEGGILIIHTGRETVEAIPLNSHTLKALVDLDVKVRSFTAAVDSLSLCIRKEVRDIEPTRILGTIGIDRNLRNVCVGNQTRVTYYDMTKSAEIAERTSRIVGSFKRYDRRIRRRLSSKYGERRKVGVDYILHQVSKRIVAEAKENRQAIVFEDLSGIRKLYRKGNGQSRHHRGRMNSWPLNELKRQVEYKAAWEGIPVVTLTRKETNGTTMDCPRCGRDSNRQPKTIGNTIASCGARNVGGGWTGTSWQS